MNMAATENWNVKSIQNVNILLPDNMYSTELFPIGLLFRSITFQSSLKKAQLSVWYIYIAWNYCFAQNQLSHKVLCFIWEQIGLHINSF